MSFKEKVLAVLVGLMLIWAFLSNALAAYGVTAWWIW